MELHVIFGTGPTGAAAMRALVEQGKAVRMINRSGKPSTATGSALPPNVEICAGDAYSAASVRSLTAGAAAVYQCAQPEYHEWAEKFPPLQAAVLEGTAANDAKLVLMENLYMVGDTGGAPIHEGLPHNAHTRKGRVRAAMAEQAMAAHRAGKLRVTSARASDFYGPAYMVTADQIFYAALAGKRAQGMGNLDVPHSFTYTEDVGRALAILGTHDAADGRAWHVPTAPAMTQRELLSKVFALAGTTPKIGAVGRGMMRLAGLFVPAAREMVEMMYEFEQSFILDSSAFTRTFGMTATPLEVGLRATLDWFRAHPKASR
ncbi:MAG: NAD-dependent epimerase/dehydratase family protein [Anaerolineae bacterium]|nr:NAD-dependent epimerase/dehydratase family protein [Anaerolineae bacterium]NUQ06316.1 NAD-dependent epimerase/dehydratase family protein [Anaerolineae bacterium]